MLESRKERRNSLTDLDTTLLKVVHDLLPYVSPSKINDRFTLMTSRKGNPKTFVYFRRFSRTLVWTFDMY